MGMVTRQLQRLIEDVRQTGSLESLEAASACIRENEHIFGITIPPDVLVDFAECTCALGHYDKAAEAIELYETTEPETSQTLARANLIRGLLEARRAKELCLTGMNLVRQILFALSFVDEATRIILAGPKEDRQVELIFNASLVFVSITRPLLRPGWKKYLVGAFENLLRSVSAAAAKQAGERGAKERLHSEQPTHSEPVSDISWRINLILQYASCLADAGKIVDAFKTTDDATKLFAADGPEAEQKAEIHTERTGLEWKLMMARVELARDSEPLVAVVRKETEKSAWSRMQMTALFASRLPGPEAATGLAKSWALVDPDFFTLYSRESDEFHWGPGEALETALAGLPAVTASANEQLAAGLLVRTAMELSLWSLASLMVKRLKCWKKLTSRCTLMQELLATEVDVYLSEYEQEPAQDNVVSADDEERRMKAAVAKRIHAVKVIEECLVTAEQNSFCSDFIEECAVSMWNMARPLLLAPSRSLVYRSLHRASEALENIESSLATLRVNLLYQVALCEAEEDLPAVAKESIEKALSIDFSTPSESRTLSASVVSGTSAHQGDNLNLREPTQSPDSRCLDRYFKTLLESIKPQVVLDDEFVILDQMQLLVDRSKSALSLRNYLPKIEALKDQALAELAESEKETATPLHDPVEAEVNQTGREAKLDRLLRLMNNVAQHAYAYGQFSVAATFCKTVLRLTENRRDELSPILQDDEEEKTPAERDGDSAPPAVRLMVPAHHKQTAIAVVQSCYTLALCLSHILKMEFKELPGVDTSNGKVERISTDSDEFPVSTATRLAGQKKGTAKAMKMKQDIVQLLLVGSRLSKDFEQFWLISNGAIHFWNLHKHILESRAFDRTRSVSLLEHVQELQTHLLVKHEVFPVRNTILLQNLTIFLTQHALASSNLAVTEEAISRALPFLGRSGCKDIVASLFEGGTAACTNSTWIEQLLKANVNNDPPIAPAPSPSKAGKSAKQQATSPAVLAELPSDLMGGEIRALILMERISKETDIPTKESLITRCYDIIQAMPVGTEATRDLQAEMKVRLAVRAFSLHTLFLRLSLAFALEAVGEDRQHVPYSLSATISRRKRLWLGISHTVAGLSLSSIHSDRSCPNASSGQALALLHLLQACQCAQSTQNASLALFACQSLWNVAAPLLPVAELRRDLINAIRAALPIVGVARRSEALPTLAKLYLGLLSCLSAEGEWRDVIAVADKAFLQLPKSVHSQVLRFQLLAISQSEKKPFAEISEKATSESASEGDLLLFCARALPVGHSDAVKLYERAIEIMEGSSDLKAADAHLELADLFLLSSEPWSQVSKHIKAALALADDADDMQRRCSFLKTFRGDKGSSSDAKETTYIPELGFDIHQRAKTLTLLATPDADEFLAALSDASTAVVERFAKPTEDAGSVPWDVEDSERSSASQVEIATESENEGVSDVPLAGNAFAGKVLDIRDMAKPLQVQGEQPLPKHPVTAPASSSDFEDSRLFHNSREHRRFENYSLAVEACRTLQNVLFQLGLEAWSIPVLHRHLELLRAAGSEPGWVFNREFLHLEQTLCTMRLARAFHICEGATGKQTVLMSMSSVVDSTLDALSKFLPSLLARSCDLAHVPGAGLEAEAASTFYVQQFQQAAAAKLFVDLAEEFYFWGESRAAFEFAIAALQKALTAEATETEVVIRAAGCVGALQTGEGRDSPACVFLKAVLHAEGGGASATTLAAVAETLILARPRSEKSEMLDELLTGVIHALEELDRRCRTKDVHRAGAKRLRPNDIPSFDRGLLHGDSTMSTKFSAETLLIKEELPSRPVLHSLWKARLQLLRLDRSAADLGDRLRVATPAGVLDRLTAVVSDVQTVVDSLLSSPLLIFILPRLVPLFVNLCDLVENLHQEPDRVGSIPEEGVCTQRQTASSQTEATSPAIYNQERDELIARLRRMAAIIGDRITLPSLRQDIRLCPPDMLSSLHRSVSFFGVIRARLERLSCYTQLLDPAAPDVSTCLLPLESMSFPGMVEFLTASRERRAVDEWLRKTARQSGHREGNVKDARRLLGEALDSLANLGTLPYQTLKAEADKEIVEFRRQVLRSLRGGVGLASVFSLNETEISFLSEVALLNLHIAHAAQELLHLEKAGETETEFVLQLWETPMSASCGELRMEIEDYRSFLVEISALSLAKGKSQPGSTLGARVSPWQGTLRRPPVENCQFTSALKEVENCLFYCLAARMYDRAKATGHALHLYGSGNTNSDSVERTFHSLTTLQALQTAVQAEWVHQSLSDPTVLENVYENDLRRLQKVWFHPSAVPRVQELEACLLRKSPFWRAQSSVWQLTTQIILQHICPRQLCVVSLQYRDHSLYMVAALTLQGLEGGEGSSDAVRYFAEKVTLPHQLRVQHADTEPVDRLVEAILVHMMESLELKLYRTSLYERVQAFQENRPARECHPQHLLLLPDPSLVHFVFEKFEVIVRLFGPHVSRDYSLHFFAHRMLQTEDSFCTPNRRSVSEMNISFARESVIVLAGPSIEGGDNKRQHSPSELSEQKDGQAWSTHDSSAPDHCSIHCARYTTEDFVDCMCTQSPQVLWTPSVEQLFQQGINPEQLLALDLSHLTLIGTLDWNSHKAAVQNAARYQWKSMRNRNSTLRDCDVTLLLSLQGVSAIVLNDYTVPEATVRHGARTLNELLRTQQTLASTETSLESRMRCPEKKRTGTPAATSSMHSGADSRKKPSVGNAANPTDFEVNKRQSSALRDTPTDDHAERATDLPGLQAPPTAVLYGIPWVTAGHPGRGQAKGDHGTNGVPTKGKQKP